jgi:membrane protease YdiL (CAAX protease family)
VSTSSGQNRFSISSIADSREPGFLRLALTGEAGLLLLAWGLGRWLGISPLQQLHFDLGALLGGVAATAPLLLALAWMLAARSGPVHQLVSFVLEHLGPLVAALSVSQLALLAALAGISEEVLFRGVVQVALARVLPEPGALLTASVLFGLVHLATKAYAILAGLMGLYLGALLLLQGSLVAPIITHALYDFIALIYVAQRYRNSRAGSPLPE